MSNEKTNRQQHLIENVEEILDVGFYSRASRQLEIMMGEVAALAQLIIDNHAFAITEWRQQINEANRQIARRLVNNNKRLSPYVPVRVKVVHSHGDICIRFYRQLYDHATRRASKYAYEIPFRRGTEKFDWRTMRSALQRTPELVSVFRITESMASNILPLSREINKIRRFFMNMDKRIARLKGGKSRRSKMDVAPNAAAAPKSSSTVSTTPKQTPHHVSKQRWDLEDELMLLRRP